MVWNQSTGYTHQKHYVLNDAVDEAKRLGVRKYGQKFVVLESICEIVPVPEVKLNMLDWELIGAFIVFVLMFVLMTLADDWDSVNGTENNAPVTYDEASDGIEKT